MARVLVVDGANVVGSVPDGWWRDRAGAAARLHASVVTAQEAGSLPYDSVVLVLEGQARGGVPMSGDPNGEPGGEAVVTVHAPGLGDDEIVAQCVSAVTAGHEVAVASADRGLLARVEPYGVAVVGPRTVRFTSR